MNHAYIRNAFGISMYRRPLIFRIKQKQPKLIEHLRKPHEENLHQIPLEIFAILVLKNGS